MMTATELAELMDAYKATMPPQTRIPREDWQSHSVRVIRETIVECDGRERAYLLRLLLVKAPWFPDEIDFKSIWYQEQRRQLNVSGTALAAGEWDDQSDQSDTQEPGASAQPLTRPGLVKTLKPIVQPEDYRSTSERILQELLAEHPTWRVYGESRMTPFFTELATRVPFEFDPNNRPEHQTEEQRKQFQVIWFEVCAQTMGFVQPAKYVEAIIEPPKPKAKQLTLF